MVTNTGRRRRAKSTPLPAPRLAQQARGALLQDPR